jgi:hypothetical protein
MDTRRLRHRERWRRWLQWTCATVSGYLLGIVVITFLANDPTYIKESSPLILGIGGAVLGGAVGWGQWFVLRRYTVVTAWWVLASSAGGLLGFALVPALDAVLPPLPSFQPASREAARELARTVIPLLMGLRASLIGAVIGMVLGGAQWWVLRRVIRPASWWVIVNGLGWMVGLGVSVALQEVAGLIGVLLVMGVAIGAIPGLTMQRWLQHDRREAP